MVGLITKFENERGCIRTIGVSDVRFQSTMPFELGDVVEFEIDEIESAYQCMLCAGEIKLKTEI